MTTCFPFSNYIQISNDSHAIKATMSFGFGVGDFLATIKLANKVRTRFVDAPEQFKAVSKEWVLLSIVFSKF